MARKKSLICIATLTLVVAVFCFGVIDSSAQSQSTPEASLSGGGQGQIAFASNRDDNWEIYIMDTDGKNVHNLTNNAGDDIAPVWSPDGSQIAFISRRVNKQNLYRMNADGTNLVKLTDNSFQISAPAWSPDGQRIAFVPFDELVSATLRHKERWFSPDCPHTYSTWKSSIQRGHQMENALFSLLPIGIFSP